MDLTSFSGSGFQYIQQQLLLGSDSEARSVNSNPRGERLSESAKHLMIHLLKDENVRLNDRSSNGNLMKRLRPQRTHDERKVMDPSLSDEAILDLAYRNEISLFGSILSILDQYLRYGDPAAAATNAPSSVPTKYILQKCVCAVPPHQTPGLLSAQDMIHMALHFLCQEYCPTARSDPQNSSLEFRLPVLYSTSTMGDLERRSYAKAYDWNFDAIFPQIISFEEEFYNAILDEFFVSDVVHSDAPSSSYHWLPREKFCPNIRSDDALRRPLLLRGHTQVTTNSKPKVKSSLPKKRKKSLDEPEPPTLSEAKKRDDESTPITGDDGFGANSAECGKEA